MSWSARGPSLNAATKSPFKKQVLPTSGPPPLLKGQTGLFLFFLFSLSFSSLPLSPFLFLMPFPSPSKIPHLSSTCKVCPHLTHHGLSHLALTHQGPNSWHIITKSRLEKKETYGRHSRSHSLQLQVERFSPAPPLVPSPPTPPPPTTATPPYHPTNTATPPSPATDTLGFEIPDQSWSIPSLWQKVFIILIKVCTFSVWASSGQRLLTESTNVIGPDLEKFPHPSVTSQSEHFQAHSIHLNSRRC